MDSQTIDSLADMICGDGGDYPLYRTGSGLTRFFHRVGFSNLTHDGSTRKWWTLDVLVGLTEKKLRTDPAPKPKRVIRTIAGRKKNIPLGFMSTSFYLLRVLLPHLL